jgi:hypothetical protein
MTVQSTIPSEGVAAGVGDGAGVAVGAAVGVAVVPKKAILLLLNASRAQPVTSNKISRLITAAKTLLRIGVSFQHSRTAVYIFIIP